MFRLLHFMHGVMVCFMHGLSFVTCGGDCLTTVVMSRKCVLNSHLLFLCFYRVTLVHTPHPNFGSNSLYKRDRRAKAVITPSQNSSEFRTATQHGKCRALLGCLHAKVAAAAKSPPFQELRRFVLLHNKEDQHWVVQGGE